MKNHKGECSNLDETAYRSLHSGKVAKLGPMLFALVLHKLVTSIEVDDDCLHLILEAWYLDDGVLSGKRSAVIRALLLIEEHGPHLGLHINFSKHELFSRNGNSHFPPVV